MMLGVGKPLTSATVNAWLWRTMVSSCHVVLECLLEWSLCVVPQSLLSLQPRWSRLWQFLRLQKSQPVSWSTWRVKSASLPNTFKELLLVCEMELQIHILSSWVGQDKMYTHQGNIVICSFLELVRWYIDCPLSATCTCLSCVNPQHNYSHWTAFAFLYM